MDGSTLDGLRAALRASPDNAPLRALLVKELHAADELDEAVELLRGRDPRDFDEAGRRAASAALLDAGVADESLRWADGDEPATRVARARALAALDRTAEGRTLYADAVRENPTLEDPELGALLQSRVRTVGGPGDADGAGDRAGGDRGGGGRDGGGRPRLRVISNDDTTEETVERVLVPDPEPVTFADVGGLSAIKRQIEKRIILPFQKPSLFRRFRKRVGGGILLYGPPGCGKTLLARATAGECEATFLNVAISDVLDMFIGESEQKLHALFEKARSSAPAVLFFDEIEALGGKRQYNREASSSKLVSQFLSEMDGFAQDNHGVLVLGATNVPWAVDPAFRRPGRFDRVLFVPPPDREARRAILQIVLRDRPSAEGIDLDRLARRTSGFSGADLQNLVESAADEAIEASIESGDEVPIAGAHLDAALAEVRPTTSEWLTSARNYARYANEGGQYDEVLDFLKRHGKKG